MSDLLITHGQVFTLGRQNELISDGAIYIEGDTIAEVGATAALAAKYPAAERLDAAGKIVLPGSICGHTHFYGAFARGMAIPGAPATNFVEILERLWWRLDRALLWDDIRYSALICLVDAIRHGCTTLIDHHASPNAIDGSLDIIADAVKETGLRASLCYEVTDRNGMAGAAAGISENVRFLKRCLKRAGPAVGGLLRPPRRADPLRSRRWKPARGQPRGWTPASTSTWPRTRPTRIESLRKYNLRVVERLQTFGILGPRTIAVHCVHLDEYEKDILHESGTWVTHQPRSNMNNAVGLPDVAGLLKRGINVALGNDGFSNNMFDEMKAAYLAHKLNLRNPQAMPGDAVWQMAYDNNAALSRIFFPKPLAELRTGAFADIIFLDYAPPTPLTTGNLPWHVIFGVDGAHVTHTIASGKVLMKIAG